MTSKKVAVVGCGAAGLVAARELSREGHEVVVFERGTQLGGTWVYTPETETDSLGLDPTRTIVHSSLYKSLRTNIPRELLGFRDFPFVDSGLPDRDPRRFPKHEEVLKYLEDFACEYKLNDLIRYQTEVLFVGPEIEGKWKVKSRRNSMDELDEIYDAVVICNGHYTQPRIADIPGIEVWPRWQCHSHNYRTPDPYRDQVAVLIGGSVSAADICQDITGVAKEVHVACRSESSRNFIQKHGFDNVFVHPMIDRVHEDGRVVFEDDTDVIADIILHCTGYKYHYPFLHTGGAVNVEDNRVGPLYKHVFPPALAPGISFIGIPNFIVPFLHYELQSKWIAGVLSGRISLPSEDEMMQDIQAFYSKLEAKNVPKRHTHKLSDFEFEIEDWLAEQCGCPPIEKWRKDAFYAGFIDLITRPTTYRDDQGFSEESTQTAHQ
ncbi:flavin-containing monooxygenase FMO GS-OX-like 3 [Silene latifolia]|uniref:flavin-containing monooxygenase FMO GS-OX-like 3 n=1 Tax=Silene latifolia TaxID=37657 RepID=UPI003D7788C4